MSVALYAFIPIVILLAIVQATVLPAFPIFGIAPGLWLVVTIGWSLLRGTREGLVVAFVSGLFIDLLSAAPMGVTSLSLMLAITLVTFLQRHLPKNQTLIPALLTALATIVFWFIYLLLLRILIPILLGSQELLGIADIRAGAGRNTVLDDIGRGYGLSPSILRLIIQSAAIHGLLVIPFYWILNTLQRAFSRRRVEI